MKKPQYIWAVVDTTTGCVLAMSQTRDVARVKKIDCMRYTKNKCRLAKMQFAEWSR